MKAGAQPAAWPAQAVRPVRVARGRMHFVGIDFDHCDIRGAINWIRQAAQDDRFSYVVTPNAQHAAMLDHPERASWKPGACAAVAAADLCLNDSRVLAGLALALGIHLPIALGSDLTREMIAGDVAADLDIILIGGTSRDAAWLRQALPNREICHFAPPMGVRDRPELQAEIAEFVESHGRCIVFLAIGAPQSEMVAHLLASRDKARGVALCIGASIEFLSGVKRRAPGWMQRAGLEWLYRLCSEPTRLWRRYLVECPRIFKIAVRERWRGQ